MLKHTLIAIILIVFSIVLFVHSTDKTTQDKSSKSQIQQSVKNEQTQNQTVKCPNCPSQCEIKPGQTGTCGRYKNVDGKLVPEKK